MIAKTECAACFIPVRVNVDTGEAIATIPSNGKRGAGHVPAHSKSTYGSFDGHLILWDCPGCGYADSTYAGGQARKQLS